MPTPNQTPQTALVVGASGQFGETWQLVVNDLSQPYRTWYLYTPVSGDKQISVLPYAIEGSLFNPRLDVYTGTPSGGVHPYGLTEWPEINPTSNNGPTSTTVPLTLGTPVYIALRNIGTGTLVHAAFEIRFQTNPRSTAQAGSIIISDDTTDYPATVIDANTGEPLNYFPFPAGEYGLVQPLPDGRIVHEDINAPRALAFFSAQLEEYARWVHPAGHLIGGIWYDDEHYIYTLIDPIAPGNTKLVKLNSDDGTEVWTQTLSFATTSLEALGISPDGTIAYITESTSATTLRRWDIVNQVELSAFGPFQTNYNALLDVLVLPNGDILVPLNKFTGLGSVFLVERWSAAGVLQQTYDLGDNLGFGRIALDPRDTNIMWVLGQDDDGIYNLVWTVNLTTSVQTIPVQTPIFSQGVGFESGDPDDLARFGASSSCPIIIASEDIPGEPPEFETPPPGTSIPCPCPPKGGSPPLGPTPKPPKDEPLPPLVSQCGFGGLMPDGNDTVQPESWL